MKKLLLIGVLLIAVLVSGCVEFPETPTTTDGNVQNQVESAPTPESQPETIHATGEDVEVDYLAYKVTKAETFTEMGTSVFKKETNGKFVKVYLDITNNAKETKDIFSPRFTLVDHQDRRYDRLSDDILYIADGLELGKQVQPGLTTSGAIVFELPKDSENLVLVIKGDWLSTSQIKVSLSNIQNIGKDTTQKQEQDAMIDEAMADAQKQMDDLMKQYS